MWAQASPLLGGLTLAGGRQVGRIRAVSRRRRRNVGLDFLAPLPDQLIHRGRFDAALPAAGAERAEFASVRHPLDGADAVVEPCVAQALHDCGDGEPFAAVRHPGPPVCQIRQSYRLSQITPCGGWVAGCVTLAINLPDPPDWPNLPHHATLVAMPHTDRERDTVTDTSHTPHEHRTQPDRKLLSRARVLHLVLVGLAAAATAVAVAHAWLAAEGALAGEWRTAAGSVGLAGMQVFVVLLFSALAREMRQLIRDEVRS